MTKRLNSKLDYSFTFSQKFLSIIHFEKPVKGGKLSIFLYTDIRVRLQSEERETRVCSPASRMTLRGGKGEEKCAKKVALFRHVTRREREKEEMCACCCVHSLPTDTPGEMKSRTRQQ